MFERLVDAYPDSVQLVYRHFPLNSIHANAQKAAEAAEAAGAQGKFWEYHDALFANQSEWSKMSETDFRAYLIGLADELDLAVEQFTSDLDNDVYADYVSSLEQEAVGLGMPGTPSVVLNGELLPGVPQDYELWNQFVQSQLQMAEAEAQLAEIQYDAAPEMMIDPEKQYIATVTLENGDSFKIELYPKSAPETVNSFVFLTREGWFDGVTFHRVIPGFVAQTGDPTGLGVGDPGYTLPDEIDPNLSHDHAGVVSMANAGPNTSGSQWFITYDDASFLDGSYSIFGEVIEGMDVVNELTPRDPQDPNAPEGTRIDTVTIEEN